MQYSLCKAKVDILVGMAGERDLTKTPEMGRVARADYVIFTPDNPANDDPKMLTAELAKVQHIKTILNLMIVQKG